MPLSSFASIRWLVGPTQIVGFNYYPAVRISGSARQGYVPMAMPSRRWSGLLKACRADLVTSGPGNHCRKNPPVRKRRFCSRYLHSSCSFGLAALYESWSIPLAVLLTVPLGMFGAVVAASSRGLANDVYFTVGLITIIGLAAKDAILIIEFAKDLRAQGKSTTVAVLEACHLRFRPIVMTGMAFVFGVAPMVIAQGARSESPAGARHGGHRRYDRGGGAGAADGSGILCRRREDIRAQAAVGCLSRKALSF